VFEIIGGALVGVDIIGIFQLVTLHALDIPLTGALYLFVISLPLLAFFVFSLHVERTRSCSIRIWYKDIAAVLGIMSTVAALAFLIFHLSKIAAMIFGLLCGVSLLFINIHLNLADRRNNGSG
jgi:hypothetical protein